MARHWGEILDFWFGDFSVPDYPTQDRYQLWFGKSEHTDKIVRDGFFSDLERAAHGEHGDWESDPRGRLALILLLDQFPRMIYRETPQAFAYDEAAQTLSLEGMSERCDEALNPFERLFFYLPLEHAESLELQRRSVDAVQRLLASSTSELAGKLAGYLDYAVRHFEVIERFGRFPHRNGMLKRDSTPEETIYLQQPGAFF